MSCASNACAEGIGVRHGMITTIHDMTNTQSILDTPHKDLRRARASSLSLIPTSTEALNQPAARPLIGGFIMRKFAAEYPDFLFSTVDDYLSSAKN